jgi:hypothetical protein
MIAHLVIFRPRPDLAERDRQGLADALTAALREIPSIRRARIGRRVVHGRPYEALMRVDYQYAALLEFDDLDGLQAYLQHPAHEGLGARFFASFEEALMYDFDLKDGERGIEELLRAAAT